MSMPDLNTTNSGRSGMLGKHAFYPETELKGKILISPTDSSGDYTCTITNAALSADRTYTIPEVGAAANFLMSAGAQSLTAPLTFTGTITTAINLAGTITTGVLVAKTVSTAIRVGNWVGLGATGSAVPFAAAQDVYTDGQLDILAVFGESSSNLTSAYSAKCGRFRHLVSGTAMTAAQETYGLIGQVCAKGTTLTHLHGGLMGTFEGTGASVVCNSGYALGGHAGVIARIGGHANITATTPLAGFLAFNNASAALASGSSIAFLANAYSASYPWTYGLSLPRGAVVNAVKIGAFASSAATTGGILFSTAQDIYSDGQLSTCDIHGASSSNLTSAYCAKVIRARHLVNVGTGNLAHETYGVMGQVVVKDTTLQHLHAGLIGTFEGHTSGVVVNGSYAYGAAGVMARVGGGAAITATKAVCGMVSFWNGAALASGKSIGFGNCHLTTAWTYGFANAVGAVTADMKVQAEDSGSLHACIFSGAATDDAGIVSQVGADSLWADGSLYLSVVAGAGKLFQKQNNTWVDMQV